MPVNNGEDKKHIPSSNHPWRNYANRPRPVNQEAEKKVKSNYRKLKIVLAEVLENWEHIEIEVQTSYGIDRRYLSEVSDDKIAHWLVGFLGQYRRTIYQQEDNIDGA